MMYSPQSPYPAQEPSGAASYAPQDPYPAQQSLSTEAYFLPNPFLPQQTFTASPLHIYSAQQSFDAYSPSVQHTFGASQGPYPAQQSFSMLPYTPQGSAYSAQEGLATPQSDETSRNLQAKRAIINGLIAFVLSVFTLATLAGFAGLITATLAIVYGCLGLKVSKQLPNSMGRRQAAIGIGLGCLAWLVVILALILRAVSY